MNKPLPPKWSLKFFHWFCDPDCVEDIEGDLYERFDKRLSQNKPARWLFVMDIFRLLRPGIIREFKFSQKLNNYDMFKNYLKISFRVFKKEKSFSLINLSGLILGFLCCLLIYIFIKDELSYDKFHMDGDRVYRLSGAYMREGVWEPYASNSWKTAELFKTSFDEVEELVRIRPYNEFVIHDEKRILEENMAFVDKGFFNVFSFPLLAGNPKTALDGIGKVVISESIARKYFGYQDPMGKVLLVSDTSFQLQVSGIMEDMPSNSHFHFDILMSPQTQKAVAHSALYASVGWDSQRVYVKMKQDANIEAVEAEFMNFIDTNLEYLTSGNFKLFFQPLFDIHLHSKIGLEIEPNGDIKNVYIFSFVGLFILFIACINYINLTTAKSLKRAKEVGMRKVLGAHRTNLMNQFLLESYVMTFVAILVSFVLAMIILPYFNEFASKSIGLVELFQPQLLVTIIAAFLLIGLVAGSYPSFVLSAHKVSNTIKSGRYTDQASLKMRKGLVILQFAISIGLIASTVVVLKQLKFMQEKDLGINEEMVVAIPLKTMDRGNLEAFSNAVTNSSLVESVGFTNMKLPGWISNSTYYKAQDVELDEEARKSLKIIRVDYNFLDLVEAEIVAGRNYSKEFPSDLGSSIIMNEAAIEQLGWKEPIGKWLELGEDRFNTIGVVKNFHFESLHRRIAPTIYILTDNFLSWAYAKVNPAQKQASLDHLRSIYGEFVTNRDFEYTFVEDDVVKQYEAEKKFTQVFEVFTVLAIIIASLGTFGLISYEAERKTKEIGIRKVLGASMKNLTMLLTKEFLLFLLVASLIAWPITFYMMRDWMNDFIYRTDIGVLPFVLATIIALMTASSISIYRSVRAARANPVESLRDE